LTGGTGGPELTVYQEFIPPEIKTLNFHNDTTNEDVNINYKVFPVIMKSSNVMGGYGNWWANGYNNNLINCTYNLNGSIAGKAAPVVTITQTPTITNNLTCKKTHYWAPGALGTGDQAISNFTWYTVATFIFLTPIIIKDVAEFEITFSYSWSRL
jgi:hypothetical protein